MAKPLLLSAVIHIIILAIIMIYSVSDSTIVVPSETVHIRILSHAINGSITGRSRAASPSESIRDFRENPDIPSLSLIGDSPDIREEIRIPAKQTANIDVSDIRFAAPPQPALADLVGKDAIDVADPFEGMESLLPESEDHSVAGDNPWSLSWANGRERGILSYPKVDTEVFPEETGKLKNIVVRVLVSPQGDVLTAEIVPPGSGDIRIDRYMNNAALELVLEPWPDDEGTQEAHLRLLFMDGSQ